MFVPIVVAAERQSGTHFLPVASRLIVTCSSTRSIHGLYSIVSYFIMSMNLRSHHSAFAIAAIVEQAELPS